MAHKLVTGHAAKKKSKHKVRHMHISRADNGFMAETHYMPADGGEKEPAAYQEPETKVFNSHKDLASHVMDTFGGGMAAADKPKDDAGEEAEEEE